MAVILSKNELRRRPYRGIYKEIAREKGVTRQYVHQAIWDLHLPEYLRLLRQKIEQRRIESAIASAADRIDADGLTLLK